MRGDGCVRRGNRENFSSTGCLAGEWRFLPGLGYARNASKMAKAFCTAGTFASSNR
jgi:hypothetical protein